MVTAHESAKADGPQVRWDLIGADPKATLLGYMGVTSVPNVIERLLKAGMDPATPAAMVERGTTSRHRVVRAAVSKLPEAVKRAGVKPPALFVIGPTVAHGTELEWFVQRPLFGHRLVIPAPAGEIGEALELAGAEVLEVLLPVTPAARVVMAALPLTGCVFRTEAEVDAFEDERDGPAFSGDETIFSIGSGASARARKLKWKNVRELKEPVPATDLIEAFRSQHPYWSAPSAVICAQRGPCLAILPRFTP